LQKEVILRQFTPVVSRQASAYFEFVSHKEAQELEKFYSLKKLPSMLGSSSFKEYVKKKFMGLVNRVEDPESKALVPDVDKPLS